MKFVRALCRTVRLVTAWGGRKGILRAWGVLTMNIVGAATFFNVFEIERTEPKNGDSGKEKGAVEGEKSHQPISGSCQAADKQPEK